MAIGLRLREYVLRRDDYRCVYCGARPPRFYLQLDHVVPKARGGRTHPANLVAACGPCNRQKTDRPIEVTLEILTRLAKETRFRWSDLRDVA